MAKQGRPLPEDLLSKSLEKLTLISKVIGLSLVRSVSSRQEQVELLTVAGYSIREIADLLGISHKTVSVIQFSLRKRDRKERARLSKSTSKS